MHQVEFLFQPLKRKNWFLTQTNIFSLLTWEQCYSVKLSAGVCLHTADILTSHRVLNDQPTKTLISIQQTAAKAQTFTLCFLHCLVLHCLILHSLILHSVSTLSESALSYLQLQHLTVHPADIISSCSSGTSTSSIFSSRRDFILLTFRHPAAKYFLFKVSYSLKARCLNNSLGF